jgi:hypothetical protein
MRNFTNYYNSDFQKDISLFFSEIPDESKFHEDPENKNVFSIQYEKLTPEKNHLNFLITSQKEYFAVSLFFIVLIDMVFYTYYQNNYARFNSLTKYPKFIGNCLSLCKYHLHPKEIFTAINHGKKSNDKNLIFLEKFNEAIEPMEKETLNFINQYFPEIDSKELWNKCKNEFPN